jgi:hypothetical protein
VRTVCDRCEGADPVGEDGGGEVFAGTGTGGSLNSKDPTHAATPGLRGSHAEPVPVSQGSPARKVNRASLEMRDTFKVCRGVYESSREGTENTQNETLRHADLFPSLVCGIGVFVRHRDSRVCHRRSGHMWDPPHIP